jgi:N utilization substance protein B
MTEIIRPHVRNARRRSRELALQGVYQWLLNPVDTGAIDAHLREAPGFEKADRILFDSLLHGAIRDVDELAVLIEPHLDRTWAELSPVEKAVLLTATHELRHHPDVPYKVVINEAIELSKTFGGTDGFKYVNGVLDRLAVQLRSVEVGR